MTIEKPPPIRIKLRVTVLAVAVAGLLALNAVARKAPVETFFLASDDGDAGPPPSQEEVQPAPPPSPPPPLPVPDRRLRFRDGSIVTLLGGDAEVNLSYVHDRRIVSELINGAARFEIARRPSRVFRVSAGEVTVESAGMLGELSRQASGLHVRVLEGRARVLWSKGQRQLRKGDQGVFPPQPALD